MTVDRRLELVGQTPVTELYRTELAEVGTSYKVIRYRNVMKKHPKLESETPRKPTKK